MLFFLLVAISNFFFSFWHFYFNLKQSSVLQPLCLFSYTNDKLNFIALLRSTWLASKSSWFDVKQRD